MIHFSNPVAPSTVLTFIQSYRSFENMSYPNANALLERVANRRNLVAITGQWKTHQRTFAPFYLQLDSETQIRLLHQWNIYDEQDAYYLQQYQLDPLFGSYMQNKPATALTMHALIRFFSKKSLSQQPIPGVYLEALPLQLQREANARNWGNYFLSLKENNQIITSLLGIL